MAMQTIVLIGKQFFFGEVAVSYGNFIFFTYSHKFENSSIFSADYRKYNYPAASLSLIVSDLLPAIKKGVLLTILNCIPL